MALFIVLQRSPDGHVHGKLLSRFLIAAALGYAIYAILPGIGPAMSFGSAFPDSLPAAADTAPALLVNDTLAPRNAMPSLHTAWALMILLAAWRMGLWARFAGGLFLAGTLAATMGLGEHYLVDLIVAVPFVVAVEGLADNPFMHHGRREAQQALAGGLLMTAAWLLAIRFGIDLLRAMPALAWLMTLVTIATSTGLLVRLLHRPRQAVAIAAEYRPVDAVHAGTRAA